MIRALRKAALAGLLVPAVGLAADEAKVTVKNDVTYATVDGQELKFDVAMPAEGNGPFPAVLVIHGGAWRGGNKKDTGSLLPQFAKRGYVAVSPQYRLIPKAIFPGQVHDVKAAVRALRARASEFKVDPEHIGATGFSAGGHLALMLAVTDGDDGLEGDAPKDAPSSRVQAAVNYFGPTDLGADDIPPVSQPLVKDFIGGTPAEKPEECKKASPLTFVTKDDPPILTFQGTKDPLVPYTQAYRLTDAQTKVGAPGRVELLVGVGHGWGGDDLKRTLAETVEFFDKHLKPAK